MLRFIPIGGFLGAGKTTAMLAAARRMEAAGERVSIVTNDQGVDLVDTQLARAANVDSVSEVTGGCFCCRFNDLTAVIERLTKDIQPTVIMAEAVGSCTDLQSTVVRPLRQIHGDTVDVAPLVVLVDPVRYGTMSQLWSAGPDNEPDMAYLFRHQLDEADVIAVNKADLLTTDEIRMVVDHIQTRFPAAQVVACSAATGDGLDVLIQTWTSGTAQPGRRAFAVDYERYGAAEAELAWTNQTFDLAAIGMSFVPADWVEQFLSAFSRGIGGATIGHVKIRLTTTDGATKASLTGGGEASYDGQHRNPAISAAVTLNARVAMPPADLERAISESSASADAASGTSAGPRTGDIFRPGFPVPAHRM